MADLLDDMVDNKKYINYTDPDEWLPFFSSMQNLVKQICRQSDLQQKNYKSLKSKYEEQQSEKELLQAKFATQQGELHKLQLDYETLAADAKKLVSVEKLFNELKQKYKVMDRDLEQKSRLIAEIKPQLTQYEQEKFRLTKKVESLETRIDGQVSEIQALKQTIRETTDSDLQKRYQTLRESKVVRTSRLSQ